MPGSTRWQGGKFASLVGVATACALIATPTGAAPPDAGPRPVAQEVAAKPSSDIRQLRRQGKTCLVTGKAAPPTVRSAKPGTRRGKRSVSTCGASGGQARGDFNNDGFADLAVGAPGEDVGTVVDAGTVTVVYGSSNGLSLSGNAQVFDQAALNTPNGAAQPGDRFGSALASGDYNGDGFGDLAVGAPGNQIGNPETPLEGVGEVDILFGSATGLSATRTQFIENRFAAVPANNNFGASLAWGQYGGGPEADLAVGAPGRFDEGGVILFHGSSTGLVSQRTHTLGSVFGFRLGQDFVQFGHELTGADFNDDGFADLAIGVPGVDLKPPPGSPGDEVDLARIEDAGAVVVLNGSSTGLTTAGALFLRQGRDGLAEQPDGSDRFGGAVTGGDLNGDGFADLAIGASGENVADETGSRGAVHVVFGSNAGLTTAGNRLIMGPEASFLLRFGGALVTGDFQGDGVADLVIGASGATAGAVPNAGAVHIFYGTPAGGLSTTAQVWHLDVGGVAGTAQNDGQYGASLTAWNFGKTSQADLVIGSPFADVGTINRAGGFGVLYGSPAGLTATGSQFITENTVGIPGTAEAFDVFGTAAY